MNVGIKHNGSFITGHVIEYSREHKICSGIGTLDIVIEGTYSGTFDPWDTIDIYEGGSFQVRYYISEVSKNIPKDTISLSCQDKSKRVVDYFIPQSYTIDYPSYTRYWIEKFLDEAGVSYMFRTTSQGNLISNNTALGLMPAFEQITQLLQLSGWYMFFDGNGIAIIGNLTTDLGNVKATFGKNTILNIAKVSNDKMLRNRAVVWGAYDGGKQEYSYADVKVNTRWNYDKSDYRTMVVSNSNIPNKSSAYGIANTLLKEFAKITVEKHLAVVGTPNVGLGDIVRVRSDVYNGSGLITTFGVSMSKTGLVTNLILDERCPRLFGFFDFGDYVYVGTYGDGVWRKHLQFDPTWYNFSDGLTNLAVTDLHINNEVFGAITSSGEMFYSPSNEGPWIVHEIQSLTSSLSDSIDDTAGSGIMSSGVVLTTFSGLMGRATIIDKQINSVKFGIDTYSGINYGDYFLTYSGINFVTLSGDQFIINSGGDQIPTSGNRSWIVEYNPFTLFSGVYPVSYSGNFNCLIVDLENDGLNDYVSVKIPGITIIPHTNLGYDFGSHTAQAVGYNQDYNTIVSFGTMATLSGISSGYSASITSVQCLSVFDNESTGERDLVYRKGGSFNRDRLTLGGTITSTTLTSPTFSAPTGTAPLYTTKLTTNLYRMYFESGTRLDGSAGISTLPAVVKIAYRDWNALSNTLSASEITVATMTVPLDAYHTFQHYDGFSSIVNSKYYGYVIKYVTNDFPAGSDPDFANKANNYIEIYALIVDLTSGTVAHNGLVKRIDYRTGDAPAFAGQSWTISTSTNAGQRLVFNRGAQASIVFFVSEYSNPFGAGAFEYDNYVVYSNDGINFNQTTVQQILTSFSDPDIYVMDTGSDTNGNQKVEGIQLTGERFIYYGLGNISYGGGDTMLTVVGGPGGTTISIQHTGSTTIPWNYVGTNIWGLFGPNDTHFIAKNGSDWYFCNPQTLSPEVLFNPAGYTLNKPYSTTDTLGPYYYWKATNTITSDLVILKATTSAIVDVVKPSSGYSDNAGARMFICGNFFVDWVYSTTSFTAKYLYLNNSVNVPDKGIGYAVLQRQDTNFHLIQEATKPIRLDISNSSPIMTVQDVENTFISDYVFNNELTQVLTSHGFGLSIPSGVRDFRYAIMTLPSGVTISGVDSTSSGILMADKLLLYVMQSGVYYSNTDTLSSGFTVMFPIQSGIAERLETSNYVASGQYIFVTTSGDSPAFYQKDPTLETFVYYSGLPVSRATIIRLDDRI
jgi:hypothetical protein